MSEKEPPVTYFESVVADLFQTHAVQTAPRRREFNQTHYEVILAVGNDHYARVTLDMDSLKALCDRTGFPMDRILEGQNGY